MIALIYNDAICNFEIFIHFIYHHHHLFREQTHLLRQHEECVVRTHSFRFERTPNVKNPRTKKKIIDCGAWSPLVLLKI